MKRIAAVLSCLLLLAALVACAMYYQNQAEGEQIENAGMAENAPVEIKALAYQGEEYLLKKHLRKLNLKQFVKMPVHYKTMKSHLMI